MFCFYRFSFLQIVSNRPNNKNKLYLYKKYFWKKIWPSVLVFMLTVVASCRVGSPSSFSRRPAHWFSRPLIPQDGWHVSPRSQSCCLSWSFFKKENCVTNSIKWMHHIFILKHERYTFWYISLDERGEKSIVRCIWDHLYNYVSAGFFLNFRTNGCGSL